jgi:hypothetical protein
MMIFRILFVILAATGCQTTQDYISPNLPPALESRFDRCLELDAGGILHAQVGERIYRSELEWVGSPTFQGHFLSPAGNSLLSFKQTDSGMSFRGRGSASTPDLRFDDEKFFILNGYWTPLNIRELQCFLVQKWPRSWLSHTVSRYPKSDSFRFFFADAKRDISLKLKISNGRGTGCADLLWEPYWFVTRSLNVCLNVSKSTTTISFDDMKFRFHRMD